MKNSPTAQWWQYPLSRPSARFESVNNYVRQLDVRYGQLPAANKSMWDRWGRLYPWWKRCLPWIFDFDPFTPSTEEGLAVYRGNNASRLQNGLDVTDVPIEPATLPDHDTVLQVGSVFLTVTWGGRLSAPTGDYSAQVFAVGLNHEPESGPAMSKFSYVSCQTVLYGGNIDLSDIIIKRPGLAALGCIVAGVAIGDKTGVPFVGKRVVFTPPYS